MTCKSTDRPLGCWQIFFSHLILDKPTPVHMHCCVYQMSNWIPKQWQFVIDVSVLYKFFVYCNKHISRWCAKQWQAILNVSDIARPSPQGYCKDDRVCPLTNLLKLVWYIKNSWYSLSWTIYFFANQCQDILYGYSCLFLKIYLFVTLYISYCNKHFAESNAGGYTFQMHAIHPSGYVPNIFSTKVVLTRYQIVDIKITLYYIFYNKYLFIFVFITTYQMYILTLNIVWIMVLIWVSQLRLQST